MYINVKSLGSRGIFYAGILTENNSIKQLKTIFFAKM